LFVIDGFIDLAAKMVSEVLRALNKKIENG
jgi:hypothetical protein